MVFSSFWYTVSQFQHFIDFPLISVWKIAKNIIDCSYLVFYVHQTFTDCVWYTHFCVEMYYFWFVDIFFAISEKKVQNRLYINTFQTNLRNICLSVMEIEFCLSSVVCRLWTAFSLCRGLVYLLKVRYITLVVPNVAEVLISNTVFVAAWKHCPMSENNITQINVIYV